MLVLYNEGGIYMDTDMNPIKKIKDWELIKDNKTFVITFEPLKPPGFEHLNRI